MAYKPIVILRNPLWIKISSIIIGYSIWSALAHFESVSKNLEVPVCFYKKNGFNICAPETMNVTICGPRRYMHYLNKKFIAFNIDVSDYARGEHEILLNETNLFLPEPLKLIDLKESIISITIE